MPLVRIETLPGSKQFLIAGEGIADLASVEILPGGTVRMGATGDEPNGIGFARGTVASGKLAQIVLEGFVSGTLTGGTVAAGDRLTLATSGVVVSVNSLFASGLIASTQGLVSGIQSASGLISGFAAVSGFFSGFAGFTGRIIGRALTSGLSGNPIQLLATVGG